MTQPILPPGWQPDESLQRHIPPPHDYRTFQRLPENPARYAVCVLGSGVFDIYDNRFLSNRPKEKDCPRQRYELNPGHNTKTFFRFNAWLVCRAALGPAPKPKLQAHHKDDGGPKDDNWVNLMWQTPKQNRAIEAERKGPRPSKRRVGEANGRSKLHPENLKSFIRKYDQDQITGHPIRWWWDAMANGISERQLRRIISGQSRQDEVAEIRRQILEENSNKP
jgi:hypothetical protein